jgi:methylase of polypeptide subunit release factors
MLEKDSGGQAHGNAEYQWNEFDSEYYFQHYYGEPHPDDDLVIRVAVEVMKQATPAGNDLDIVDVGTGPNLISVFLHLCSGRKVHGLGICSHER